MHAKNNAEVMRNSGTIKAALKHSEYNNAFPSKILPNNDHCSRLLNIKNPLNTWLT